MSAKRKRGVSNFSPLVFTVPSGPVSLEIPDGITGREVAEVGRWIESHGNLMQWEEKESASSPPTEIAGE